MGATMRARRAADRPGAVGRVERRRVEPLWPTAYHEAGHAVMALRLGRRFRYATVRPEEDRLGHVRYYAANYRPDGGDSDAARLTTEQHILTLLAGAAAERRFAGRTDRVGAKADYERAADLAGYVCGSQEEATAYLRWLSVRTGNTLGVWWGAVVAIAEALRDQGHLDYAAALELWRRTPPAPAPRPTPSSS
jgi:hypothetical protein